MTLDQVRASLTLPAFDVQAAQAHMAPPIRPMLREDRPGTPKLAAVLVLLYPAAIESESTQLTFALMRRTEYPGAHSGQISLPGGSAEPGETWTQTALRETCEEFGVCDPVEILGALTPLYVPPSDFEIHPVVGALPERPVWRPDPREVAQIVEVPLHHLLDERYKQYEDRTFGDGRTIRVPHYRLCEQTVWGATAIILSEFEHRLRTVMRAP